MFTFQDFLYDLFVQVWVPRDDEFEMTERMTETLPVLRERVYTHVIQVLDEERIQQISLIKATDPLRVYEYYDSSVPEYPQVVAESLKSFESQYLSYAK